MLDNYLYTYEDKLLILFNNYKVTFILNKPKSLESEKPKDLLIALKKLKLKQITA